MKTIVQLRFTLDEFGKIIRNAPFMAYDGHAASFYENDLTVLAQIDTNDKTAYFEAEMGVDGHWKFGSRVSENEWIMQGGEVPELVA
jgi:hypothetical protein